MANRPKIKIVRTISDQIIEIFGLMLILIVWFYTLTSYKSLPDMIPIHFNGAGEADGFGDKWTIMTLPMVSTILYIGLSVLNKYPHIFNYPTEITIENARVQYTNATQLIRYLKVIIVLIFGMIDCQTIRHAIGASEGLGIWFLPVTLLMIFAPIFYYLIKTSSGK